MTSNVLRVPRPKGSGRPNVNRVLTSVWIPRPALDELNRIAAEVGVNRSDVIRLALKHGLDQAERELKRST